MKIIEDQWNFRQNPRNIKENNRMCEVDVKSLQAAPETLRTAGHVLHSKTQMLMKRYEKENES